MAEGMKSLVQESSAEDIIGDIARERDKKKESMHASEPAPTQAPVSVDVELGLEPQLMANLSVRMPRETAVALNRAVSTRKITGEQPYSKQDIVTTALNQWLKKSGFLTS